MKNLIVIGAGMMGREAASYAAEAGYFVKGFLDSREKILDGFVGYPPIIGRVEDYTPQDDELFICAIGCPDDRRKYVEMMRGEGALFASIVHPLAYVGNNVKIGVGCLIAPHATVTNDVTIGDHVIVNVNASISHDCVIGSFATISPGVNIAGICHVGEGAFLGIQSALIPSVELGSGAYVAAGAVVTKSFLEHDLIAGVPARQVKRLGVSDA